MIKDTQTVSIKITDAEYSAPQKQMRQSSDSNSWAVRAKRLRSLHVLALIILVAMTTSIHSKYWKPMQGGMGPMLFSEISLQFFSVSQNSIHQPLTNVPEIVLY